MKYQQPSHMLTVCFILSHVWWLHILVYFCYAKFIFRCWQVLALLAHYIFTILWSIPLLAWCFDIVIQIFSSLLHKSKVKKKKKCFPHLDIISSKQKFGDVRLGYVYVIYIFVFHPVSLSMNFTMVCGWMLSLKHM
jgi:hypothetical protein